MIWAYYVNNGHRNSTTTRADYECLCNHQVELAVYPQPNGPNSNTLGQLYVFDCKATVPNAPGLVPGWAAIEYEHSLGYVTVDQHAVIQTCPGDPQASDLITTVEPVSTTQAYETRAPPSTTVTTTVEPTTVTSTPLSTTNKPTEDTTTTTATTTSTTTTTQVPTTTVQPTTAQPTAVPTTTQSTTTPAPVTAKPAATSTAEITTTQALPVSAGAHVLSGHTELCPTSWQTAASRSGSVLGQYGSHCYELVNHRYHWKHAESYCNGQGGHLFHMSSRDEEKYILSFLQQHNFNHSVWTGLHDLNSEEHFEWISGDPITYTNWIPGRKSNFYSNQQEDCVVLVPYLYSGDWDDIPCGETIIGTFETETHYFICQIKGSSGDVRANDIIHQGSKRDIRVNDVIYLTKGTSNASTTVPPQALLTGDIHHCTSSLQQYAKSHNYPLGQHGTSCYELVKHTYSWSHGEQYCKDHGGHLVHVSNAEEEAYILNFLRTHSYANHAIWTGLNDHNTEEHFHWTSGNPLTYTNWIPGRQSNFVHHSREDCVVLMPYKNGMWDDIPCGSHSVFFGDSGEKYAFVCQFVFVFAVILVLAVATARADYECLCNQHVELAVYPQPNPNTNSLGQLYEFDCKATVPNAPGLVPGWAAIEYEHSLGYVTVDQQAGIQTCPGDPPVPDLITTVEPVTTTQPFETRAPPSTAVTTTVEPVTTTQAFETRAPPSTAVTSTVEPTTVTSTPLSTTNKPTEATTTTTTSTTTTTQVPTTTVQPTTAQPTAVPTTTPPTATPAPVTATPAATSTAQITTTQALPVTTGTHVLSGHTELCPTSWQTAASRSGSVLGQYGSHCYELVNHRYHWKHAESYCNGQGGHLFHMSSRDEEKYILSFLQQHNFNHSVWTGLHDLNSEEHFEWTSGDPITYTNWIPGRKSNFYSHQQEDCVVLVPYLYSGDWDDIPCGETIIGTFETETHYFICQISTSSASTTVPPQALLAGDIHHCSSSLQQHSTSYKYPLGQHGTSCYELVKHTYTWSHGEQYCKDHGGHLVHVSNAEEEAYILNFLRTHGYANHAIWTGLNDLNTEEHFHWTSGNPLTYTNWIPGRQNNFFHHSREDCVVLIPYKNGMWDDIPCGSHSFLFGDSGEQYAFVCQFDVGSHSPLAGGLIGK